MPPDNFYWGSAGTHMHVCGCRQIRMIHMELSYRPANYSPQAKSDSLLFIYSLWAKSRRMGCIFLQDWERREYKKKSSISRHMKSISWQIKFKFQCSSMRFYWDTDIFTYLSPVCGCNHYATKAELSSGNRDSVTPQSTEYFYQALYRKLCH